MSRIWGLLSSVESFEIWISSFGKDAGLEEIYLKNTDNHVFQVSGAGFRLEIASVAID